MSEDCPETCTAGILAWSGVVGTCIDHCGKVLGDHIVKVDEVPKLARVGIVDGIAQAVGVASNIAEEDVEASVGEDKAERFGRGVEDPCCAGVEKAVLEECDWARNILGRWCFAVGNTNKSEIETV